MIEEENSTFPKESYQSVHCTKASSSDFEIKVDIENEKALYHVIEIQEHSTFTHHREIEIDVVNHQLVWKEAGLSLLVVFERYQNTGRKSYALIKGAINDGDIATSWAHDHHNVMVMGRNVNDMVKEQNEIAEKQDGYCVVHNQKLKAFAKLNVGLGTDGPSSGNTLDLFTQFKMFATFHKNHHHDCSLFPSKEIIELGTIKGVKCLGIDRTFKKCLSIKERESIL